ncbi:MAG: glycosyltransferase family 4 protein [Acidimicrobiales bacterium]|nr:glycosyltransferase family 4 protein [Acidimicrobiales bacterium]
MTADDELSAEATEQLLLGEAIARLSREIQDIRRDFDERIEYNARQARSLRKLVERMRLDRQLRRIPHATRQAIKRSTGKRAPDGTIGEDQAKPVIPYVASSKSTLLAVAHAYPIDESVYGGQPLARRAKYYRDAGHDFAVFVPSRDGTSRKTTAADGTEVVISTLDSLNEYGRSRGATQLLIHSPTPEIWSHAAYLAELMPTHVWMHGFESRSWRELGFDFTAAQIRDRGPRLDAYDTEKAKVLRTIMADPRVNTVFVSAFMQSISEAFAGTAAATPHVIHNVIDLEAFPYRRRTAADRMKVAVIRSFDKRNYGTDLATMAILELRKKPWFDELAIRVIGDGCYFEQDTEPLRGLANVSLEQGFLGPSDLSVVLSQSGVALLPTRWDSQGMMIGEAMAAGVVPVTNAVAAIPEFVDADCAMLADDEDYRGLAAGVAELVEHPDRYEHLSLAAHHRARTQCGAAYTVERELKLIAEAKAASVDG